MTLLTTLKAGLVAAALGVGALAAAPAQAAPAPSFSFSFNLGGGGGPGVYFDYGGKKKFLCLSDRQIVWQLRDYGFRHIQIQRSKGYTVVVIASWHGDWYRLQINRCSGKIIRQRIDYYEDNFPGTGSGPGFGITLNF